MTGTPGYNFAYLDEQTKRMIRRAILKAVAIPGYQVPFASRDMPLPYGWGTGGMQVTAACLGPTDVLKVIDQGADDTTNAVSIRAFFARTAGVRTTTRTAEATIVQTRHRVPERPLRDGQILVYQVPIPDALAHARAARARDPPAARAGRLRHHACPALRGHRAHGPGDDELSTIRCSSTAATSWRRSPIPQVGLRLGVTAGGNIGEPLMAVGERHYGAIRAAATDWLRRVEIDPARIDDGPRAFSGGMQQRLQIARNLVSAPRLVFMDEPTGGLDVSVQARLLDLIRGLVADLGLSVVLVTHDLGVARLLAHRMLVMRGGRVVETGLTDQVLEDPQHAYTQLLVASILPS